MFSALSNLLFPSFKKSSKPNNQPVRLVLEQLEKREMFNTSPFLVRQIQPVQGTSTSPTTQIREQAPAPPPKSLFNPSRVLFFLKAKSDPSSKM